MEGEILTVWEKANEKKKKKVPDAVRGDKWQSGDCLLSVLKKTSTEFESKHLENLTAT